MGFNLSINQVFFALLPDAFLAKFINKGIKREKLGLAQTMPHTYRRECLSRGCLGAGFVYIYLGNVILSLFHVLYRSRGTHRSEQKSDETKFKKV